MCGIAGFASRTPLLDAQRLAAMSAALAHRGPDDRGLATWSAAGQRDPAGPAAVGLAHRRLSVIDLSAAARQPMSNEDGTVWIAYNGEAYNFAAWRPELERAGHVFRSRSDTETILHLYEQHGLDGALRRLNGMFAFALWDGRRRRLLLARDRLGKKPLYYTWRADGSLLFASEIGALLASGLVDRDALDPLAFRQFWTYGYAMGERTIYRDIRRLPPAHCAVWEDGRLERQAYWDCPFGLAPLAGRSLDDLADELEALLGDAIRLRLIADVPLGLFLSGGVDSSLVAALAAQVSGRSLRAFTIAFPQQAFNEAPQAAAVAGHLGLEHRVLTVSEELSGRFAAIAAGFGEPFGDSSAIPTWFVSRLAREHVTVALTGDGGDELFAGYDSYAEGLRLWGAPAQRRRFARPRRGAQRLWDLKRRLTPRARRLAGWEAIAGGRHLRRVLSRRLFAETAGADPAAERRRWLAPVARADLLSQMQYLDLKTYLPDDILVKVDRMSMAHALECRSPFLDYRVVEFAARLPEEAKLDAAGRGKRLLRHLLARRLPPSLFERPKQGFAVPWADWCGGEAGRRLRERWRRLRLPYVRPEAAAFLFPEAGPGLPRLQWNAFATLVFAEGSQA